MRKRTSLITILALALLAATSAWSAGTAVGQDISNTANVTYYDANGTIIGNNVASNTVHTTVTQIGGVVVAAGVTTGNGANNTFVNYAVDIENNGNGSDTINFTVATSAGWSPASITVYNDVDNNDAYTAGVDTLIPAGSYTTGAILAEAVFDIIVRVEIPNGDVAAGGAPNSVLVTGTSVFDNTKTGSVTLTTTANAAVLTVDLVANDTTPVPGQVITFTATITNNGNAGSSDIGCSNLIPGGFTFVPGSIVLGGPGSIDFVGGVVSGVLTGPLAVGASTTVAFQATLNSGVVSGTPINFVQSISHMAGTAPLVVTDTEPLTVGAGSGLTVSVGSSADTKTPGDVTSFPFDVTNGGSINDTFDLTSAGGAAGYVYTFGTDATCSSAITDTGVMAPGATATFYVCATVPATAGDTTTSTITITVTSAADVTKTFTSGNLVTTVTAPVLGILKAVDLANAAPGDTLTYTITVTNSGTGNATAILISDVVPAFTTYTPGTIQAGFSGSVAARTDSANSDGARFNANTVSAGDDGMVINLDNASGVNKVYILSYQVTVD